MTKRRDARAAKRPTKRTSRISLGLIAGVAALAILLGVGLIVLGQSRPETSPGTAPTTWNVKGDPAAPVEIEEWSDFG